jgi:hypothetical protein
MESVGYLLIYFLKGKLPWQDHYSLQNRSERHKRIKEDKIYMTLEELTSDLPKEFEKYMKYCRRLKFD